MHQAIENTQPSFGNQQYNGAFNPCVVPYKLSYSFDYERFENSDLSNRAKSALGSFFGFMGATLDSLISIGRMLRELYNDCVASLPNGKKVFDSWISSSDFGASQYLAKSSMEIAGWFDGLQPIRQESIRSKVQKWSVSALVQLSKVADKFLEEVVSGGKKTAAQVKQAVQSLAPSIKKAPTQSMKAPALEEEGENISSTSPTHPLTASPTPSLLPGMRIVVKTNDAYNGSVGIITAKDGNNFWVLLDYTAAQNSVAKMLFKPEQLEPEIFRGANFKALFTLEQVEQQVQKALAAKERELEEKKQGDFLKLKEDAEKAAGATIKSYQQRLQVLEENKQELLQKLDAQDTELAFVSSLQARNQQLEQRVADLEKVIDSSNKGNTPAPVPKTNEAVKPDFVLMLPVLMSEVKELKGVISTQQQELTQLRAINTELQQEIQFGRQSLESNTDVEEVIKEFARVGESLGWNGWNRYGYRAVDGTLHKDVDAIKSFVADLKEEYQGAPEMVFQN